MERIGLIILMVEGVMIMGELVLLFFLMKHIRELRNYIAVLDNHLDKLRAYVRQLGK